ncbi:hypothetical protein C1N50_22965 [Vibrio campbellii]|nr:hypothetical protein C1N50_22965 [Vibrio campbellii]
MLQTLIGPILLILYRIGNLIIGYNLGKRKLNNYKLGMVVGFILSLTPPFNIIFYIILYLKKDQPKVQQN